MKTEQRLIKRHLFICTNTKEFKDSCGAKDSEVIVNTLKDRLRESDLWDDFKVTASGCLGPCAKGISATLYPDNLLITEITINDIDELYKLLT